MGKEHSTRVQHNPLLQWKNTHTDTHTTYIISNSAVKCLWKRPLEYIDKSNTNNYTALMPVSPSITCAKLHCTNCTQLMLSRGLTYSSLAPKLRFPTTNEKQYSDFVSARMTQALLHQRNTCQTRWVCVQRPALLFTCFIPFNTVFFFF